MATENSVMDLNVGGQIFTTSVFTLIKPFPESKLAERTKQFIASAEEVSTDSSSFHVDSKGRLFFDRDPATFSYVLNYLRDLAEDHSMNDANDTTEVESSKFRWLLELPTLDQVRFKDECHHFGMLVPEVLKQSASADAFFQYSTSQKSDTASKRGHGRNMSIRRTTTGPKYISIGYRATYSVSRDALSNDKFRRITRITVSGNADAAKEVFDDDINDSRDPDRQPCGGYTSRYYLKHNHLEKAFESLSAKGFDLISSTSSGSKTLSPQSDEYKQWTAYIDYVFYRK